MFRLFLFLVAVLVLGLLFAWVADNPGNVIVQWEWFAAKLGRPGQGVEISLILALTALVALIAVVMFVWGLLRGLINTPSVISRFFDNRRRDRGYQALSQGLIAASSGDVDMARRLAKESGKLLRNEPLVSLLGTQTALLEGKRDEARANFQHMLENDNTRLVALRGLFLEAERQGEAEAARHYAEEAVKRSPSLPWAGIAKLRYQAADAAWDDALQTLEANRAAGLIDKADAKRKRAVLLTAKAIAEEPGDPDEARSHAKEAHSLAKDFVPAAVVFSRAASRLGDIRGATKVLEATWKLSPHPEIAEAYANVRSGDSVLDRLKRAKRLESLKANHPEGNLAVAAAAIDAHDWKTAREALEPVLISHLSERACLLMADIEEGEHGDRGRMRNWLARAVRAPADPVWVADGHVSEEWLPISPVTGEIDAFEWKVPVEQLGKAAEQVITIEELHAEAKPAEPEAQGGSEVPVEENPVEDAEEIIEANAEEAATDAPQSLAEEEIKPETDGKTPDPEPDAKEETPVVKESEMPPVANEKTSEDHVDEKMVRFPLDHRPDDPGVDPAKVPDKKGFKLF